MTFKQLDLGARGQRPSAGSLVALALAAAVLTWAAADLMDSLDANAEANGMLERSLRRQADAAHAAVNASPRNASQDAQSAAAAALLLRLQAPWDAAFSAVEFVAVDLHGDVSIDSMHQQVAEGGAEVSIIARAKSEEAILSFLDAMPSRPEVREVRLLDQQKDKRDAADSRFRVVFKVGPR